MNTWAFLLMMAAGAASAFLLGLAVLLPGMIRRGGDRRGVWARHD